MAHSLGAFVMSGYRREKVTGARIEAFKWFGSMQDNDEFMEIARSVGADVRRDTESVL
jgi:hypothetical protein